MDKKLKNLIEKEIKRQNETIDLIPSENFASPEIRKILSSPLTNKYSEGYPGRRYYPGNTNCDEIEILAQDYALKAFGLKRGEWSVNIQPYSGSPANLAVYAGLLYPGELIMGMKLSAGGHLTHGHTVSMTGKFFRSVQYGVDKETDLLDYDQIEKMALENEPKIIVSGTTAYPRKIDFKRMGEIARKVQAYHLADISHIAGLIIAKKHPSPFKDADIVTMTTHKTLRGPRGAVIFSRRIPTIGDPKLTIAEAIDKAVFPGLQGGPHNNQTAAIAQAFADAITPGFKSYQKQIILNSKVFAKALRTKGFKLVTDGTDNHLLVIDLRNINLDGMTAEKMLEDNGILANRNTVPGDTSPFRPSGIRMGTPSVTSRGFTENDMLELAELIRKILVDKKLVIKEVKALALKRNAKKLLEWK